MSANALQKAVVDRLASDARIVAIIGPNCIFDRQITRIEPPYLVLGESTINDYSTGDAGDLGAGSEHIFEIEVWSKHNGRKQALELADAVRSALHDADLALSGAKLINLRHQRTLTRRPPKTHFHIARLRFRAICEP